MPLDNENISKAVELIGEINPKNSILFLGSGFSKESKNISGQNPPDKRELKRRFLKLINRDQNSDLSLEVVAEFFARQDKKRLLKEILNNFRIKSTSTNQKIILNEDWYRIYTTNYDDTVETAGLELRKKFIPYDQYDPEPKVKGRNTVIHLHGSLKNLNEENVDKALVLSHSSYDRQYDNPSPWFKVFKRDVASAARIFVIGYSALDYHINSFLLENPSNRKKIIFIQPNKPDEDTKLITENYGTTLFLGLDGFAQVLNELPRFSRRKNFYELKDFTYFNRNDIPIDGRSPTGNEINELLIYGKVDIAMAVNHYGTNNYLVHRQNQIDEVIELINFNKSIVIIGDLGSGKSVLLFHAMIELSKKFNCFIFERNGSFFDEELDIIAESNNPLIFFTRYSDAQDVISKIKDRVPNAKFIVEIGSSIFRVRFHEVDLLVPTPYNHVDTEFISKNEFNTVMMIAHNAGVVSSKSNIPVRRKLNEVLLNYFETESIRRRIQSEISKIIQNRDSKSVLMTTLILSLYNIAIDPGFIRIVSKVDPYPELLRNPEISNLIFEFKDQSFSVRSPVFAKHVLSKIIDKRELYQCVIDIAQKAANQSEKSRNYKKMIANVLQYSELSRLFKGLVDEKDLCIEVYETLRENQIINSEPHFWLNYAIALANKNLPDFDGALRYIGTAYERAAKQENFKTFQIDTQGLSIMLRAEAAESSRVPVQYLEEIIENLDKLDRMLSDRSHRYFIIKVISEIPAFTKRRAADIDKNSATYLVFRLHSMRKAIANLQDDYWKKSGSSIEIVSGYLESAISYLAPTT